MKFSHVGTVSNTDRLLYKAFFFLFSPDIFIKNVWQMNLHIDLLRGM